MDSKKNNEPENANAKEEKKDKTEEAKQSEVPIDQQWANYAYNMQVIGEEKMAQYSFQEAYDNMVIAAESYIKVTKMSKDPQLISTVKAKLVPLLDRVEKCKYQIKNQFKFKDNAGYTIPKGPTFADEVKSFIKSAMAPESASTNPQPYSRRDNPPASAPSSAPAQKKGDAGGKFKYSGELQAIIEQSILEKSSMVKWEDLIGLDDVKKKMLETIVLPIKNPELFTGLLTPSKGILLFGPPGNGKTMVAKAVASQCGESITFFNLSAGALTSRFYGDSEKLVKALFSIAAERQPSVIFIDELDSILGARSSEEHEASRRLKTEFLVNFDGVGTKQEDKIVVVGATNRPFDLDEAVLRRFAARIFLPLPNSAARMQMIKGKLAGANHELTDKDIEAIANKTDGYSFADLTAVCQEAAMGPIRSLDYEKLATLKKEEVPKLQAKHFEEAIVKVPKSVSLKSIKDYEIWNNNNKK